MIAVIIRKCDSKNDLITKISGHISDRKLKIILSHADADHVNLIESFLNRGNADLVAYGGRKEDYPVVIRRGLSSKVSVTELNSELNNFCSPLKFNLIPSPIYTKNKNESSLVLHVKYKGSSVILSGDATGRTERKALHRLKDVKKTKLLMSSHHGAATHNSNSVKWLNYTRPESVVVSAGNIPQYGHPRCEVNKRYENYVLRYSGSHKNSCWESRRRVENLNYDRMIFNTYDLGDVTYSFNKGRIHYKNSPTVLKTHTNQNKVNTSSQDVCIPRSEIKQSLRGCCSGNSGIKRCSYSKDVMCLNQQVACKNGTYSKSCRCE